MYFFVRSDMWNKKIWNSGLRRNMTKLSVLPTILLPQQPRECRTFHAWHGAMARDCPSKWEIIQVTEYWSCLMGKAMGLGLDATLLTSSSNFQHDLWSKMSKGFADWNNRIWIETGWFVWSYSSHWKHLMQETSWIMPHLLDADVQKKTSVTNTDATLSMVPT